MATKHVRWLKTVGPDESVVFAAIDKLDALWRSSVTDVQYLKPGAGKWEAFREAVEVGAILQMPRVEFLRIRPPTIAFESGRFRFAFARDHGAKVLPIAVPREDLDLAQELFGCPQSRTTIRL